MIKVEDIKKIVKLTLLSGSLVNTKPLSLLLVADAGLGKTEMIQSYKSKKFLFMSDLSYMGLVEELEKNKKIRHLIIPDFIKITHKKRSTSDNLTSFLTLLVEEGAEIIHLGSYRCDLRVKKKPRNIGLITATTRKSFEQKRKDWGNIGFLSRMIVCSYSYSKKTTKEVFDYINSEQFLKNNNMEDLNYKDKEIKGNKQQFQRLNSIANNDFRNLKQLQILAKSHALMRGDNQVSKEDIDEISRLSYYLNLDYREI